MLDTTEIVVLFSGGALLALVLWYFFGERAARLPRPARWALLLALLCLNLTYTRKYALGEWAY